MMDRERFERHAERLRQRLRTRLTRQMGHRLRALESASDLLQSVFRTLWRRRADIPDDDREFTKIAFHVAKNKAIDRGRYYSVTSRTKSLLGDGERVPQLADATLRAPEDRLRDAEIAQQFAAAVERLSADDARIIRFMFREGASIGGLTAMLGTTSNAATVRLHRARARFVLALNAICPDLLPPRAVCAAARPAK